MSACLESYRSPDKPAIDWADPAARAA